MFKEGSDLNYFRVSYTKLVIITLLLIKMFLKIVSNLLNFLLLTIFYWSLFKFKDNIDNIKTQVGMMQSIDSSKLLAKAKGYGTRIKEMSEKWVFVFRYTV